MSDMSRRRRSRSLYLFFFNDTATTEIYTLSLHDALPIYSQVRQRRALHQNRVPRNEKSQAPMSAQRRRSEEHTSELQSHLNLVCRLLLEKKKTRVRRKCGS